MNFLTSLFFKQIDLAVLQTLYDYNIRSVAKQVGSKIYLPEYLIYSQTEFLNIEKKSFFSRNLFQHDYKKWYMNDKYDVLLSYFSISSLPTEDRLEFINNIKEIAPKTLFVDFEMAERNIAFPAYFGFTFSEYANLYFENIDNKENRNKLFKDYSNYLNKGAMEGFFYDLEKDLEIKPKRIDRRSIGLGGIGICLCEW